MSKYQPKEFEQKWIENWEKSGIYKTPDIGNWKLEIGNSKKYVLDMFPYPSGAGLHVGHPRGYTATDILSRFYRMNGKSVLHPMGWDAFGLPAENAAIKARKNPMDMVPTNIANFKRQMKMLGFSYDWDREFSTTDPNYYKWTQWLFIQFFKMGLLYKKNTPINFCPKCKTGLAEEEVLANGTHERCGSKIEKKDLPQWIFRITTYADRLLEDLKGLDWPDGIIEMQKNWIGRKEGVEIEWRIENGELRIESGELRMKVFTTRLDTIFGVTFMAVSPETILKWEKNGLEFNDLVKNYVQMSIQKSDQQRLEIVKEKTGEFTGLYAVNPVNNEKVPIWVADYVLSNVGTGAVMGVPAHDERDFDFAKKYKIKIIPVIEGDILINSEKYNGLKSDLAYEKIFAELKKINIVEKKINYHLRDWIFSRQRYWGEPIPMVYCENCAKAKISYWETGHGRAFLKQYQTISKVDQTIKNSLYGWFPIDEKNLPLELPYVESYEPTDTGESPLAKMSDWTKAACPECGADARRETDTMPNWAGSCWYYIRFAQVKSSPLRQGFAGQAKSKVQSYPTIENWKLEIENYGNWLPIDWYFGGAEHAVLHLLYSRFWVKALYDMGLVNFKEPFLKLRNVGMVLATDHHKMSKSLGNVINPDDVVAEFGADSVRMYEMFMAPFSQEIAWSTQTLQGVYRFLNRVWNLYKISNFQFPISKKEDNNLIIKLNKTIDKVTKDIEDIKFNTAIAAMMEFLNEWENKTLSIENAKKFLKILAPFAPFTTEEIWHEVFGEKQSIHLSTWPTFDKKDLIEYELKIPVQINGKVRAVLTISADSISEKVIIEKALADENVKKYLLDKKYKSIYIPNKILNFITNI